MLCAHVRANVTGREYSEHHKEDPDTPAVQDVGEEGGEKVKMHTQTDDRQTLR